MRGLGKVPLFFLQLVMEGIELPQNTLGLILKNDPARGRGVFATKSIEKNTLVDISPILLFHHDEYAQHGRHTVLDHYTYRWQNGYALALGLGSMFNHSNNPNVGYMRDMNHQLIRYTTFRPIEPGEELCISYGPHLWFENTEEQNAHKNDSDTEPDDSDWLGAIAL